MQIVLQVSFKFFKVSEADTSRGKGEIKGDNALAATDLEHVAAEEEGVVVEEGREEVEEGNRFQKMTLMLI